MKIIITSIFLIIVSLETFAQATITGTIFNSPKQTVYLRSLRGKVDSAIVGPINPVFTLKADISKETYFTIFYQKKGPFVLNQFVLLPGEHVTFFYDVGKPYDIGPAAKNLWIDVKGSPLTTERITSLKKSWIYKRDYEQQEKDIDSIRKYSSDTSEIAEKLQQMKNADMMSNQVYRETLDTTKSANNALLMLTFLGRSHNTAKNTLDSLILVTKSRFPNEDFIQKINADSYLDEMGLALNTIAPNIILKSVDGQDIDLAKTDFKYLLIDFWASWCKPCRMENPYLIKTYNEFKDKGFKILSVSIDKNEELWKQAIKDDGISGFIQLIDTQAAESIYLKEYKIWSIPANFLIDRSGKIIAKNLRGEDLNKEITKLMINN